MGSFGGENMRIQGQLHIKDFDVYGWSESTYTHISTS